MPDSLDHQLTRPTPPDPPPASALPPRSRLLHIGLAKTGTTALQYAASERRPELLRLGVRYPGTGVSHRAAVSALMGRRWGWGGPGTAGFDLAEWSKLLAEVETDTERRIWLGHEIAAEADHATAAKFIEELGPRTHVVVTMRPYGDLLVSSWQQFVKAGDSHSLDSWLHSVLADPPDTRVTPTFHLRSNQVSVVERWAAAVGPDRVHVVVVDKADPGLLTSAFEGLLDLPMGTLVEENPGGMRANRTMSAPESELLRQLNVTLKARQTDWREYDRLIRQGALLDLLESRAGVPVDERLQLPRWAAQIANDRAAEYAEAIDRSGAQVIGDIGLLARPIGFVTGAEPAPSVIEIEQAVAALAGLFVAAGGHGARTAPPISAARFMNSLTTAQIARVLLSRVRRGLHRRVANR